MSLNSKWLTYWNVWKLCFCLILWRFIQCQIRPAYITKSFHYVCIFLKGAKKYSTENLPFGSIQYLNVTVQDFSQTKYVFIHLLIATRSCLLKNVMILYVFSSHTSTFPLRMECQTNWGWFDIISSLVNALYNHYIFVFSSSAHRAMFGHTPGGVVLAKSVNSWFWNTNEASMTFSEMQTNKVKKNTCLAPLFVGNSKVEECAYLTMYSFIWCVLFGILHCLGTCTYAYVPDCCTSLKSGSLWNTEPFCQFTLRLRCRISNSRQVCHHLIPWDSDGCSFLWDTGSTSEPIVTGVFVSQRSFFEYFVLTFLNDHQPLCCTVWGSTNNMKKLHLCLQEKEKILWEYLKYISTIYPSIRLC